MARQSTVMSETQWRAFLDEERTAVLSSAGSQGFPHLVAMWYVPRDDGLWMWSYARAQKVQNLRREPRVGVLIEAGSHYDDLRGLLIQADADILDDPVAVLRLGKELHTRYAAADPGYVNADADEELAAHAAKRVAIHVPYMHVRSWDHRNLRVR